MKQYINLESIRTQKIRFWIWSSLQTRDDMRDRMSEFELERVVYYNLSLSNKLKEEPYIRFI